MKTVINGKSTRYFYQAGDILRVETTGLEFEVQSVDSKTKTVTTTTGSILPLTTEIKPTQKTLELSEVVDNTDRSIILPHELLFAKVKPNAIIPTKREEDAGFDVYTVETDTIVIPPCSTRLIDTGVAIGCNQKYFPKFFDKGGMGSNGIVIGAGVGDSGFRDSYFVPLINTNADKFLIISNQFESRVKQCDYFDFELNQFINSEELSEEEKNKERIFVEKSKCIVKFINKAFAQFVILPVPSLETKEVSWEELKSYKSERGLGKLGSSNK